MKEINLNGQPVFLPTGWNEVEFGDYEKWYTRPPQEAADYIRYLAGLCRIEEEKFLNESVEVFKEIEKILEFVFHPQFESSPSITIEERTYTVVDFDSLTLGEWVDIEDMVGGEEDAGLSDILGIVCRPVSESYDAEKAKKRAGLFRKQPCSTMMPVISFYLERKQQILQTLKWSSETASATCQYMEDIKKFAQERSIMRGLTFWQRKRYSKLTRSLEEELSKLLDYCSIEKQSV